MWLKECQQYFISVQCKTKDYLQLANANPVVNASADTKATDVKTPESPLTDHKPEPCFKVEKPKMPKYSGDVREYFIFRSDFRHLVDSRYSKRDSIALLRTCLHGKPLELIKGIGADYDAAWEYLDSIYGDP